jgi:hypothetical protein
MLIWSEFSCNNMNRLEQIIMQVDLVRTFSPFSMIFTSSSLSAVFNPAVNSSTRRTLIPKPNLKLKAKTDPAFTLLKETRSSFHLESFAHFAYCMKPVESRFYPVGLPPPRVLRICTVSSDRNLYTFAAGRAVAY